MPQGAIRGAVGSALALPAFAQPPAGPMRMKTRFSPFSRYSADPAELERAFLGQNPDLKALLRRNGLAPAA